MQTGRKAEWKAKKEKTADQHRLKINLMHWLLV